MRLEISFFYLFVSFYLIVKKGGWSKPFGFSRTFFLGFTMRLESLFREIGWLLFLGYQTFFIKLSESHFPESHFPESHFPEKIKRRKGFTLYPEKTFSIPHILTRIFSGVRGKAFSGYRIQELSFPGKRLLGKRLSGKWLSGKQLSRESYLIFLSFQGVVPQIAKSETFVFFLFEVQPRIPKRYGTYDLFGKGVFRESFFKVQAFSFQGKPFLGKGLSGEAISGEITFREIVVWGNGFSGNSFLVNSFLGYCNCSFFLFLKGN